mmetsp:Transcript_39657/g.123579  ORF Transcript_39657/g.123579 Transcript_39657/m.123579 type:complete len:522 (+) Transcript_39657:61-1626(+)
MAPRGLAVLLGALGTAAAYDNGAPHSRTPPLGWSSWVSLAPEDNHPIFDYCDEESVKHAADAFHEVGLYDAGYRHFHLDDCWSGGRNASGFLFPEKRHFPNGMRSLVDYVHSKGLSFGLYTCAGTEVCVGGRPGSRDHWLQDAAIFAEWGVDWVKMDWCHTEGLKPADTYPLMSKAMNSTGHSMHLNMCEWGRDSPWEWGPQVAQSWRMSQDHTGNWQSTKDIVRLSAAIPAANSGRPYGWNDMDMLETGNYEQAAHANGHIGNMTEDEYMTEFSMWAISASPLMVTTPIMNCTRTSTGEQRRLGGHAFPSVAGTSSSAKRATGCRIVRVEQLSKAPCEEGVSYGCFAENASMWTDKGCCAYFVLDGGDRSILCDVEGEGRHICSPQALPVPTVSCKGWISHLQRKILLNTEVIAINQDVTPQGRPVKDGDLRVWSRHLSDGSVAVALYNEEDKEQELAVDFTDLGWAPDTLAEVRDLWAHEDLGTFHGRYPAQGDFRKVPAHATALLRLSEHSRGSDLLF